MWRVVMLALWATCAAAGDEVLVKHLEGLEYPPLAAQAQIEGTVILKCVIGNDGRIERIEVLGGHRVLSQAARHNASKWTFQVPAAKNGGLHVFKLIYRFRLEGLCLAPRCTSMFSFTYPDTVTVISQSRHWTPSTDPG